MMPMFRKKPVVIEARQFGVDGVWEDVDIQNWCGGKIKMKGLIEGSQNQPDLIIHTLEGDHTASPGDWIIKGVNGEFYPCKPDIFEKTYSPDGEPMVTIKESEYKELLDNSRFLEALSGAGVDNWEGYSFAIEEYRQGEEG